VKEIKEIKFDRELLTPRLASLKGKGTILRFKKEKVYQKYRPPEVYYHECRGQPTKKEYGYAWNLIIDATVELVEDYMRKIGLNSEDFYISHVFSPRERT
jgi:hypothetical protein